MSEPCRLIMEKTPSGSPGTVYRVARPGRSLGPDARVGDAVVRQWVRRGDSRGRRSPLPWGRARSCILGNSSDGSLLGLGSGGWNDCTLRPAPGAKNRLTGG